MNNDYLQASRRVTLLSLKFLTDNTRCGKRKMWATTIRDSGIGNNQVTTRRYLGYHLHIRLSMLPTVVF
jgi:hypothetical protein